jgi:transposase
VRTARDRGRESGIGDEEPKSPATENGRCRADSRRAGAHFRATNLLRADLLHTGPSDVRAGKRRRQGISKAGNCKGRTTGIELAWLWLRYQPDSDLSIWFRTRVGTVKGRIRRIAIVALARKLLVALWHYLETGVVPQGAVLKG